MSVSVRSLRLLEVAAMPFPSHQGTQALLREQCVALAGRGHEVHLLVYANGAYRYDDPPFTIHRLGDWPRDRSLRSGPSWRKVVLDARLVLEVRRLDAALRPDVVHAHNYEALACCLAARPAAPVVYHAHTLFGYELPTFATGRAARLAAAAAGGLADRLLPPRAALTLAVSPRLVEELLARGHPAARLECSPPGFTPPPPAAAPDGRRRRRELGLDGLEVVGYSGNLDGYQDLPTLLDAIAHLATPRPRLRLLVISASAPEPLLAMAAARGVGDRVRVVAHGDFADALGAVAAADLCAVPRSAPGGFPIKLLAYLAAGRPVVTTRAGAAGLELGAAASVVPDRDPRAMAAVIEWLLDHPAEARARGAAGRALLDREHVWDVAAARLEAQLARAAASA
jgi:glycosyltransferase involved in cell wall biosynthesis